MSRALPTEEASVLTCPICDEPKDPETSDYCSMHTRAFDNVKNAFRSWTIGYGEISVPEFLKQLKSVPGTGTRVRELAQFLLENLARWE